MREKRITYELTIDMPESFNLEWVSHVIKKAIEELNRDFHITGFYLIEKEDMGEVIR